MGWQYEMEIIKVTIVCYADDIVLIVSDESTSR